VNQKPHQPTSPPVATKEASAEVLVPEAAGSAAPLALRYTEADSEAAETERMLARERSYVETLSTMEDAMRIFTRRAELLENARVVAVRMTNPEDWVISRDAEGREIAMPTSSACSKIADIYGIDLFSIGPTDSRGAFCPEVETDEKGRTTLRAWAGALSKTTGRRLELFEAARRTDEDFLGRADNQNDIRSAVLTLLRSKAARIISGLAKVPRSVLEAAWSGTGKTIDACTKGHGYGSSRDRKAQAVAPEAVKQTAAELGREIMARVGGDTDAARDLLVELTRSADGKFRGFDSIARITKDWQVENAWKALRAHKVFGDKASNIPDGGSAVPPATAAS
jgi:hypothetical protein